jgi:hypothetical protein
MKNSGKGYSNDKKGKKDGKYMCFEFFRKNWKKCLRW